jgi:hypothetical protein
MCDNCGMRLITRYFVISSTLLLFSLFCRAAEKQPIWQLDLQKYQADQNGDDIVVRFSGNFLVVYPDRKGTRLVFNIATHEPISDAELREISLPPREEEGITKPLHPFPAINIVSRWNHMSIQQVGGVGLRNVEDAEYYLTEPGKDRSLILRLPCDGNPQIVGSGYFLFRFCNGKKAVVDKSGKHLYHIATSDAYATPNAQGDRFVVYDRRESFFHQFEGTDQLRVIVYRSSDGKKLFEKRWHPAKYEGGHDGRVALSDDGLILAMVKSGKLLLFRIR